MESYRRAWHAIATGVFKREFVPVNVPQRNGTQLVVTEMRSRIEWTLQSRAC